MMNNLIEREKGHLFDESVWVIASGKKVQAQVVANSMDDAILTCDQSKTTLAKGKLIFERSQDMGYPTRVIYFIGGDYKIVVQESRLTGIRTPAVAR
jgi:hypothetical protein